MKCKSYTDEQIIGILKQHKVVDLYCDDAFCVAGSDCEEFQIVV